LILVDAIYINQGGGKALLDCFLDYIIKIDNSNNFYFLLDSRYKFDEGQKVKSLNYEFLKSSSLVRLKFYLLNHKRFSSIFCFGNVPPPIFINSKKVGIYFQNALLLDSRISDFKFIDRFYFTLKKNYIKILNSKKYYWFVQSSNIASMLNLRLNVKENRILIHPFYCVSFFRRSIKKVVSNYYTFVYVADSSPHKNHVRLLKAWLKFYRVYSDIRPVLHLTIEENSNSVLITYINRLQKLGVTIVNHGQCNKKEIANLYYNSTFLVYPSLVESFGIPLLEASSAGCKVIASDLPYVNKILKPSLVFNPFDEESIFNALSQTVLINTIPDSEIIIKNEINNIYTWFIDNSYISP
jgi:glycosyltransferase involved in cell wall biosynthesis